MYVWCILYEITMCKVKVATEKDVAVPYKSRKRVNKEKKLRSPSITTFWLTI